MCKSVENYAKEYAKKEREEIIANMLHEGMKPEEIARICKIPLAEVEEVEKSLLTTTE